MKISVIVPFYNSEKWLGRCCESLHQQEGAFNFILVNDFSTDGGRDVACQYVEKDQRFILMKNQRGKGVSGARNTGLDYAVQSGEWVTFLDADDEMLPDAYRAFYKAVWEDSRANVHQFNHVRFFAKTGKTLRRFVNTNGVYHIKNMPQAWFGVWNTLYRSEFVKDIRFDESIQYGEDGLFNLECLEKDDYIHHSEDEVVRHIFENDESLSHIKRSGDLIKQCHAYEEFLLRQTNVDLKVFCCEELSRLWGTIYKKVIAEEK